MKNKYDEQNNRRNGDKCNEHDKYRHIENNDISMMLRI